MPDKPVNIENEISNLYELVDKFNGAINEHLDDIRQRELSKILEFLFQISITVKKILETVDSYRSDVENLGLEVSDLRTAIELATKGR